MLPAKKGSGPVFRISRHRSVTVTWKSAYSAGSGAAGGATNARHRSQADPAAAPRAHTATAAKPATIQRARLGVMNCPLVASDRTSAAERPGHGHGPRPGVPPSLTDAAARVPCTPMVRRLPRGLGIAGPVEQQLPLGVQDA